MATNDQPVHLHLRLLGEWSVRTGKSAQELLGEALSDFCPPGLGVGNGQDAETLLERLSQSGLLGCLSGGPADLSTNPEHMEGFGE
jgi:hypothetical protein